MTTNELCQLAIEILSRTNDGRDLYQTPEQIERQGRNGDGWQLKLTEMAVNGFLSERGKEVFLALHRQVLAGDYLYPSDEFVRRFCPAN